jgi:UrcA family protein
MKTLLAILGCAVQTSALAWTAPASPQPSGDAVQRHLFEHAFQSRATPARTAGGAPSIVVSYEDLDLSQPAKAAMLYARLRHAARTVCPQVSGPDLERVRLARDCYATALSRAVRSVDQASLTSVYEDTTTTAARTSGR